jgi:hypothetical protein
VKTKEFCLVCNHAKQNHEARMPEILRLDAICWECDAGCFDKYHSFKLDNLKLVEDIAKQKGLV